MKYYNTALFYSNLRLPEWSDMKSDFQKDINTETGKEVIIDYSQILVDILNVLGYEY